MSNSHTVYDRYQVAVEAYCRICASAPGRWHCPDVAEFTELRQLLLPHAESGDMRCQYALASILFMGLCCESEEQHSAGHAAAREEATRWWIAAAMQGFWPALDNLISSGVGPEVQQAREAHGQLERERPDLIGSSHGMPVYGPEFMQELSRRLYGRVITDA
jgi:TPR repeat protein